MPVNVNYLKSVSAGQVLGTDDPIDELLLGELDLPTEAYVQEMRKAMSRIREKTRVRDQRKSVRMQKYWKKFEDHKFVWSNYLSSVTDHYLANWDEGLAVGASKRGRWLRPWLELMSEILTPEEHLQLRRDMISQTNTPEARKKRQFTMSDNNFREARWGLKSLIDKDNHVKCYLCDVKYIDVNAVQQHWKFKHRDVLWDTSKLIYVGNMESVWACYHCDTTMRLKPNIEKHIKQSHTEDVDNNRIVRRMVPRTPINDFPRMIGNFSTDLKERENPGGNVEILWPCYVEGCDHISYDKGALNIHFHGAGHIKRDKIEWNAKLADANKYKLEIEYATTNFVCYMDQCNDVAFRTLDLVLAHFSIQHPMVKLDPSRFLQIPAEGDEAYVVVDGVAPRTVLDNWRHNPITKSPSTTGSTLGMTYLKRGNACRRCYDKGTRCNGERPCDQCKSRGLECESRRPGDPTRKPRVAKESTAEKLGSKKSKAK